MGRVQTQILQYHVLSSEVKAAAAVDAAGKGAEIATLMGEKVKLTMKEQNVMVDSSKVTVVDVLASNGVVHLVGPDALFSACLQLLACMRQGLPRAYLVEGSRCDE